jgi:protein-L-isoaspartate(D-aspartate) O-methyltransferase
MDRKLALITIAALAVLMLTACPAPPAGESPPGDPPHPTGAAEDWATEARRNMVDRQLRARDIVDQRVLDVMGRVPRHLFIPLDNPWAYGDTPLPIGSGQTISQPYMVALMSQSLDISPTDRVLEVGTGSGYQAAVLAGLAREVYTVEIIPELARQAERTLGDLGYENVKVRCSDGYRGWPEAAPFDAIMITARAGRIPPPLLDQLKPGGRLVMPLGDTGAVQELTLVTKTKTGLIRKELCPVRFVPMTGEIEQD